MRTAPTTSRRMAGLRSLPAFFNLQTTPAACLRQGQRKTARSSGAREARFAFLSDTGRRPGPRHPNPRRRLGLTEPQSRADELKKETTMSTSLRLSYALTLAGLGALAPASQAGILYVRAGVANGNGASWATAYNSVQTAM